MPQSKPAGSFLEVDPGTRVLASAPAAGLDGWFVQWRNDATADTIELRIVCINVP